MPYRLAYIWLSLYFIITHQQNPFMRQAGQTSAHIPVYQLHDSSHKRARKFYVQTLI